MGQYVGPLNTYLTDIAKITIRGTRTKSACIDLEIYNFVLSSLFIDRLSIETLPSEIGGKFPCKGYLLLDLIYGPVLKLSLLNYLLKGISLEKFLVVAGCLNPSIF